MRPQHITITFATDAVRSVMAIITDSTNAKRPRQYRLSEWAATLASTTRLIEKIRAAVEKGPEIDLNADEISLLTHLLAIGYKARRGASKDAYLTAFEFFHDKLNTNPDYQDWQQRHKIEDEARERVRNLQTRLHAAKANLQDVEHRNRLIDEKD